MNTPTKTNLILIGMPTSGKSTVGVILAKILGMDFVDVDLLIQKRAGKKLDEIIEDVGLAGFLDIERDACLSVNARNSIIATGGSVVYRAESMEHFRSIGRIIYLDIGFDELMQRLHDVKQRGVVLWPDQTVEDLFRERLPLYEKYADVRIIEKGGGIEETVQMVLGALEND